MNIVSEFRNDPARVLDRLVDGELAADERRVLLAALEDEPAGWRQCALAFLESQSWRWQLSRVATEPLVAMRCAGEQDAAQRVSGSTLQTAQDSAASIARPVTFGGMLAIAAGLLVAFALGTQFPSAWLTRQLGPMDATIAQLDDDATHSPWIAADEMPEMLTLTWQGDNDRIETFKVPILDSPAADDFSWLQTQASALPDELVSQFREAGLDVQSQHGWYPFELSDGRRVLLPIEELEIRNRPSPVYY